jgi:hypothetical protein
VPPRPSPQVVAGVAGAIAIIAIAVVMAAAGLGRTVHPPSSSSPPGQVDGSAQPSREAIDPAVCPMTKTPAPDDPPLPQFGDGPFDPADISTAWLRLCLDRPLQRADELAAFCVWNASRTTVVGVEVLGAVGQPFSISIGATLTIGRDAADGGYRAYRDPRAPTAWDAAADRREGAAQFELGDQAIDPPASPPPLAEVAHGVVRWTCAAPPPPRPGLAAGQVRLHLDAPIGHDLTFDADCRWVTRPTGPEVSSISSTQIVPLGGFGVGIDIESVAARPDQARVTISGSGQDQQGEYRSGNGVIVVSFAPDGSSATLRLSRLSADPDLGFRFGPGMDQIDATVTWTCAPPAAPGAAAPADDGDARRTAGTATLTFDPAVAPPIRGPVTCFLNADDPSNVTLSGLIGTIAVGGGRVLVKDDGGDIIVGLIGPDGAPAGEYGGQVDRFGDDALGPIRLEIGDLAWLPSDPRYTPMGGANGPRSLELTIDATCDITSARIPGLTVGSMEVRLGSGLDRSWSVPAVCRWVAGPDGPVVTSARNLGSIDLDGQVLGVLAVPEVLVVVADYGTQYGSWTDSTLVGDVAPNGAFGQRTFTAFEPRGRIFNVNGRLGGIGGVLSVDGSIRWTCGAPPATFPPG